MARRNSPTKHRSMCTLRKPALHGIDLLQRACGPRRVRGPSALLAGLLHLGRSQLESLALLRLLLLREAGPQHALVPHALHLHMQARYAMLRTLTTQQTCPPEQTMLTACPAATPWHQGSAKVRQHPVRMEHRPSSMPWLPRALCPQISHLPRKCRLLRMTSSWVCLTSRRLRSQQGRPNLQGREVMHTSYPRLHGVRSRRA